MTLREDANQIIEAAIKSALPDTAVKQALLLFTPPTGKLITVAIGKAAPQMAAVAESVLKDKMTDGIVITKYGHANGQISTMKCMEAGHPVPDSNSYKATKIALEMVTNLTEEDAVLLLISGGGSALFESPLIEGDELEAVTNQLLSCGASIIEMNTIRKRLSAVKGGKFAKKCAPARVFSIVLSDVLGDRLDIIASGPACPDATTCSDAMDIVKKYDLKLSNKVLGLLQKETPKSLEGVTTHITGSVKQLCLAAEKECRKLGYKTTYLSSGINCIAREAGSMLASIARDHQDEDCSVAYIFGGETVVQLTGNGKGGRNQELALSAARGISGLRNTAVFSVGSDGTDGPTDAAGGYVDGDTSRLLTEQGVSIDKVLMDNDAYNALQKVDGLIFTGPTGTNVNDFGLVLIKR